MAKAKKFKSTTGYPVSVLVSDASGSSRWLRVDDTYETDDKDEQTALEASSEVATVKEKKSNG
jgi:hypothetical protein